MDQIKKPPIKVMIAAHIGKPWGGISTLFEAVLQSSLKDRFNLIFFETSINRKESGNGKLSSEAVFHSIKSVIILLFKIINRRPDVVHIATAHKGSFLKHGVMVLIAKMLRRKVILAPHCSITALMPEHYSTIWKYWVEFIIKQSDCLLVLSREWLTYSSLLPPNKIRYLPNAIKMQDLTSINRCLTDNSKITNILFLGHISKEKGLLDLLEAVSILVKNGDTIFTLDLIGEEIEKQDFEEITQMISAKRITNLVNVRKPEFGHDKLQRLRLADIFVLPSHHEGMPMAILEAMAAGLPIVATSVGGIPDLVENGVNGFLVPPDSPRELAETLKTLIQRPSLRLKMGNLGREKALQSYDIEKYAESLGAIYQELSNN